MWEGKRNASKLRIGINIGMVVLDLTLAAFAIPHLIDDFLFGIPAEFGLSNRTAQILAGIFILLFLAIFMELVRGRKRGVVGSMVMGIFLALAGILKHLPLMLKPGPYWSGWFSEFMIIGLILSGLGLAVLGTFSLRTQEPSRKESRE
jgi:hypothetical protein